MRWLLEGCLRRGSHDTRTGHGLRCRALHDGSMWVMGAADHGVVELRRWRSREGWAMGKRLLDGRGRRSAGDGDDPGLARQRGTMYRVHRGHRRAVRHLRALAVDALRWRRGVMVRLHRGRVVLDGDAPRLAGKGRPRRPHGRGRRGNPPTAAFDQHGTGLFDYRRRGRFPRRLRLLFCRMRRRGTLRRIPGCGSRAWRRRR